MKLGKRDLKTLRLALHLAINSEEALADAQRVGLKRKVEIRDGVRYARVISVVPMELRKDYSRAKRNVVRFRRLQQKIDQPKESK